MAISLGQLDLEALKNYLKIVQGFRTLEDPSKDTEQVFGVDSNLIAVAALLNGGLLVDENGEERRDVVNYALNLMRIDQDGFQVPVNANEIITYEDSKELQEVAMHASQNTANDMRSLRNEMYHLKRDMIRTGSLAYDPVYDGFIDPFIDGLTIYTEDELNVLSMDGNDFEIAGDAEVYRVGQCAAFVNDNKVISVDEILFSSGARLNTGNQNNATSITKSYGLYNNGKFVFGTDQDSNINLNDAVNMIYKDAPHRVQILELNSNSGAAGFASCIVIPHSLHGNYLNAVSLSLRTIGQPGVIYCELYDYHEDNLYAAPIATSSHLNAGMANSDWGTYQFAFNDEILLEDGHKYLLLVKGTGTYEGNVWCLGGFEEPCNYDVHQDTYLYDSEGKFVKQGPNLVTGIVSDIFIGLYTTKSKKANVTYTQSGIYTGTFKIENNLASRVRISFNPGLNGKRPESFNVEDYYTVNVVGRNTSGRYIVGERVDDIKQFSHTVWSNGQESANEFCYDFIFINREDENKPESVNYIEFQIVYNSKNSVGENNHGELFAVVASCDNAYMDKEV